jgi:hypothetical protein
MPGKRRNCFSLQRSRLKREFIDGANECYGVVTVVKNFGSGPASPETID